ncbi:MAG: glycosyltransferase family 4 protein [Pyrinomonadaceae bacterium]
MKILLLNQCFWPDVVATSQQLSMLARRLSERGHEVTVIASRRGYDNPNVVFPKRERWHKIDIFRIWSLRTDKSSRWRRALNFASFLFTLTGRLLIAPRHDVVVALTSPPLISWVGSVFTRLKGGQLIFWSMDLNPDEAIAAGWLNEYSLTAKFLARLLNSSLHRAAAIVALDRFMKERIVAKGVAQEKVEIIPPACDDGVHFDRRGREAFRLEHHLADKFVVMYAGNHSPCHPLDTVLEAADELKTRDDIVFLFAGGGSQLDRVKQFTEARKLSNIQCLPYQPLNKLGALLSSADLHLVVMGDSFKGIVHPSKIYNILSVGVPFLFIGPGESHVTDIIANMADSEVAMHAHHGEAKRIAEIILNSSQQPTGGIPVSIPEASAFLADTIYARFINVIEYAGRKTTEAAKLEAAAGISES